MTPALLAPGALIALTAIAIPLLIHISRRTESRTIDFAALRWLEARIRPRRRPRLDELPLLLCRLLLLALIALWLAEPVLRGALDRRPIAAVAPGVTLDQARPLTTEGARLVWLAPGFPPATGDAPRRPAGLMSLVRQLDAETPAGVPITFILPPVLDDADAERPRLTRRVGWRAVPGAGLPLRPDRPSPPALTVRHAPEAEDGVRYFRAAATAWTEPGLTPAFDARRADEPVEGAAQYLIWLGETPPPEAVMAWIRRGGTALLSSDTPWPASTAATVAWRDPAGEPLAVVAPLGRGRVIRLTRALTPAANPALVEPTFPDALSRMLAPPPDPARVRTVDHAPLVGAAPYTIPPADLRPWLALLIALVFLAERWLATSRRRAAAP